MTAVPDPAGTTVTRWADVPPQPWKNGGGATRELVVSPEGADDDHFEWRISVADVAAPGPFSPFPGIDRVLTLLEGPTMVLDLDGTEHALVPLEPFRFDGATPVDCTIPGGPTRDLNVMTRQGQVVADVQIRQETAPVPLGDGHHLLVALGDTELRAGDGRTWSLAAYDLVQTVEPLEAGPGTFAHILLDEADRPVEALAALVRGIPAGQVAAYGQLGRLVGLGPRAVGRLMSQLEDVPWWRVVRADGTPAACHDGVATHRLEAEGTPMRGGRVRMGEATAYVTGLLGTDRQQHGPAGGAPAGPCDR